MFKTVSIDKYRGIRHLDIKDLSQVNLFVGKNNTGKTSVLEAISILSFNKVLTDNKTYTITYESIKALFGWVYKLPFDRNYDDFNRHYNQGRDRIELNQEVLSSVMYGRNTNLFNGFSLKGQLYNDFGLGKDFVSEGVSLIVAAQYDEVRKLFNDKTGKVEDTAVKNSATSLEELKASNIDISNTREVFQYHRNSGRAGNGSSYPSGYDFTQDKNLSERIINSLNMQYIRTNSFNNFSNSLLYDRIIFDTIKIDRLIYALSIIEPDIERFAYQANEFGERSAKIKLKYNSKALPISTMGDGMNRILTIVLSLVNCQDGYLIVDEIENGLHYSVQKDLWEIIFQLSEMFNIQVFATTHSSDTIQSFAEVLASRANSDKIGKAFRLQQSQDDIVAVDYNQKELFTSTNFDVEIR